MLCANFGRLSRWFDAARLDFARRAVYRTCSFQSPSWRESIAMKIVNSLKSLKGRDRDNRVIRRRGRTYVINKVKKRFKARQG